MTLSPTERATTRRRLLFAYGRLVIAPQWYDDLDAHFRPVGLEVCRTRSGSDAIDRIEQGGLAGAVLVADDHEIQGLSLVRIIRSIDAVLPCWLVTDAASRATLEAALALRVASVITRPSGPEDIRLPVDRVLHRPLGPIES
ncbi:MAG: hypothetical protein HY287_08180 [Planctomycetes bacterium]|nr:hypothetical protein [Planctomycetota bacterium]MBI3834291.1 hypothetical protein [Planctomycetota bacterium]